MTSTTTVFPPFPEDLPTPTLEIIDYQLLKARDPTECSRLWEAGTNSGFWYLKNHGVQEYVDAMFEMGAETMALPLEEKLKYEQGDEGVPFGYKRRGGNCVDTSGVPDTTQFMNVSKDDALAYPGKVHRDYPHTVYDRMESTIVPFIRNSIEVNGTMLEVFNEFLGLPPGALLARHKVDETCVSESRVIHQPMIQDDPNRVGIGSHTDFGTLSFLHNRLGGLQLLVPGTDSWQYVKPIPGHAVCNVGDSLAILSGGILKSCFHRIVPPPGEQRKFERWSLAYFTRPNHKALLSALVDESAIIAEAVEKNPVKKYQPGVTASEWIFRRFKLQRSKNRTGPETWKASRGTEEVDIP